MKRSATIMPLSVLFESRSRLEILRVLVMEPEPKTGRQLARVAGVNHQTCWKDARFLEELGLVERNFCGTTSILSIRREHPLVARLLRPLFQHEERLVAEIRAELARALDPTAARVALGDLVCGTRDTVVAVLPGERESVARRMQALSAGLEERYDALAGFCVRGLED